MSCVCGTETPIHSPLCRRCWASLPSALRIAYSERVQGSRKIEVNAAVREYASLTRSIDNLTRLSTDAGRNKFRRADLQREIDHCEARQRALLAQCTPTPGSTTGLAVGDGGSPSRTLAGRAA